MTDERPERTPPRRGLVGRLLGGRYRITRMVSSGASTLIAEAEDTELHRPVTVKLVRPEWSEVPEFRTRFHTAMRTISALSHPNVAAIYDWGEETVGKRPTVYAVSEHLDGGSLRDLFDRGRYLEPSQALLVGLEACRGLDFAHRRGLIHSELTPAKLVFGDDRRLRIVDFGLARLLGLPQWQEPATVATHIARYASPEQALAEPLDGRTDVYSLALILVEAVTKQVPFAARSTVATLSARVGRLMPVSADLGGMASVLERAGRPVAADRSTAAEFGRALVQAAEKLPRPTPIPILISEPAMDISSLRRPDDPTGGVRRPRPERGVALVPPIEPQAVAEPEAAASVEEAAVSARSEPGPVVPPAPAARDAAPEDDSDGATARLAAAAGIVAGGGAPYSPDEEPDEHDESAGEAAPPADGPTPAGSAVVSSVGPPGRTPAADDGNAPGAVPESGGPADLPPPSLPEHPAVFDGDAEVTKDELAALATSRGTPRRDDPVATSVPGSSSVVTVAPTAPAVTAAARDAEPPTRRAVSPQAGDPPPSADSWTRGLDSLDDGRRRSRWLTALAAFLVLAALCALAFVAYLLFRVQTHEVPALAGMDVEQAEAAVAEFDWEVEVERIRSDEEPDVGQVVRTTPAAGADLAVGEPFLLVVSEGPEFRTLPELAGMRRGEVETALAELRLEATAAGEEYDEDVPTGDVISWSVPSDPALVAGGKVLPETEVQFVVSRGPEPRVVPELLDLTVDDARGRLDELRLETVIAPAVFDNDIPAGVVLGVDPPAGTTVERGTPITLTPSKGPDLVTLPDVTGMTLDQARQTLADAGLYVGGLLGNTAGTVLQTSVGGDVVEPGSEHLRYSAIDLALF